MPSCMILIPPSEGKISQGYCPPLGHLKQPVKKIYDRLMSYQGDLSQLYGVKGKALQAACNANQNISTSPTMPAIERYSGVVYDGIDYSSLTPKAKDFLKTHVRIISALFGLLKPQDLIPDYKFKIEKLDAANYWQPIIARELKGFFVVDLLPQSYQKAAVYDQGVRIDFIVYKKDKPVPAGHQGKLIKGKFIRWLCERQIADPKGFAAFKEDGFQFDGRHFIKR